MPPRYSFTCTLPDCDRQFLASGFCDSHYRRWKRHGDPYGGGRYLDSHLTDDERFRARFEVDSEGCWIWTAGCFTVGYSEFKVNGVDVYGHRWSYERFVGPIPAGLTIDHLCHSRDPVCAGGRSCRHRRCVNPAHLEAVSIAENVRRGNTRRRSA